MKSIISFVGYGFLYIFAFLCIFTIIYRLYTYRFGLKPIGCIKDKCIKQHFEDMQVRYS